MKKNLLVFMLAFSLLAGHYAYAQVATDTPIVQADPDAELKAILLQIIELLTQQINLLLHPLPAKVFDYPPAGNGGGNGFIDENGNSFTEVIVPKPAPTNAELLQRCLTNPYKTRTWSVKKCNDTYPQG